MTTQTSGKFIFAGHEWNSAECKATFTYELHHEDETFTFTETLVFPQSEPLQDVPQALLENILNNLLLALGVSYYKIYCPKELVILGFSLSKKQAEFWNTVYTKGLGEFFYKNNIDFRGLIAFPFSEEKQTQPVSFSRQDRSLVGIGGGKDSIVTAELLKKHNKSFSGFVINAHPIREEVMKLIGTSAIIVQRIFDPQLFELSDRKGSYNGHVPVSSHYAFIGILCAVLFDYRYLIVSNEQSSNYGNVDYHGMEVNHQWSKSLEFESLFQEYIHNFITSDVTYFSLLRQQAELAIVKEFVNYPQFFPHFSSCNRNFKINGEGSDRLWCGECAKCAFAFVMLAAFLSQEKVVNIFGQNLFEKNSLLQTYKELLGTAAIKPFDCVGTPEEVQVAFSLAMQKGYDNDPVMKYYKEEVLPTISDVEKLKEEVFSVSEKHNIPAEFQGVAKL